MVLGLTVPGKIEKMGYKGVDTTGLPRADMRVPAKLDSFVMAGVFIDDEECTVTSLDAKTTTVEAAESVDGGEASGARRLSVQLAEQPWR